MQISFDNALIETETGICTSLKSYFYFWFCWLVNVKSTLLNLSSVWKFVPIHWKTWWIKPEKFQNQNSDTSKIGYRLPVFLRNTRRNGPQFSDACKIWCNSVKNSGRNRSTTDTIDDNTCSKLNDIYVVHQNISFQCILMYLMAILVILCSETFSMFQLS